MEYFAAKMFEKKEKKAEPVLQWNVELSSIHNPGCVCPSLSHCAGPAASM